MWLGTCRKLRPLWIMLDMMASIMRAWGWDDLCKVMAAIQRLKRPWDHLQLSVCIGRAISSFLIQNLASPWVIVVGLSSIVAPTCASKARGGGDYLHRAPPHAHIPPAAAISPPCLSAGVRCCNTSPTFKFWPDTDLSYFLAQLSKPKKFIL